MLYPTRHSLRLSGYDYAQAGAYFLTLVTYQRAVVFEDDALRAIVQDVWQSLPRRFPNIVLDEFVVMPNHIHSIVMITLRNTPEPEVVGDLMSDSPQQPTVGQVVAYFKYQTTRRLNILCGTPGSLVWQRNYYDHIVRNEEDMDRIRQYIRNNPAQWMVDQENPANRGRPGQS